MSDALLGFYGGMWYVYSASLVPVLIGRFLCRGNEAGSITGGAVCASLSFFVTTNFMVWASSHLYPHTAAGLAASCAAGVPVYRKQ